jgi:hypothetical protein
MMDKCYAKFGLMAMIRKFTQQRSQCIKDMQMLAAMQAYEFRQMQRMADSFNRQAKLSFAARKDSLRSKHLSAKRKKINKKSERGS